MGEQRPPIRFKAQIPRVAGDISTRAADRTNQLNNAMTIHVEGSQRLRSRQHGAKWTKSPNHRKNNDVKFDNNYKSP